MVNKLPLTLLGAPLRETQMEGSYDIGGDMKIVVRGARSNGWSGRRASKDKVDVQLKRRAVTLEYENEIDLIELESTALELLSRFGQELRSERAAIDRDMKSVLTILSTKTAL